MVEVASKIASFGGTLVGGGTGGLPARRTSATVSTAKPGRQPVLVATVFEAAKRDERCDKDLGLQTPTADAPAP